MLHGTTAIFSHGVPVTVVDELRDLIACRDDTIAARHQRHCTGA